MSALISTDALAQKLHDPLIRILDASWAMPSEKRDMHAEYEALHIPGARFFDIDAISDRNSPYPHMLPRAEDFAYAVSYMGISNHHEVIVYDSNGLFSAPRVWWMFRVFGHANVRVLDGGLPKWLAENKPTEKGMVAAEPEKFVAQIEPSLLRSMDEMRNNSKTGKEQVMDARAAGRFNGSEPEPRPQLRSGHILGSINIPFKTCLEPPFNRLKPPEELHKICSDKHIDIERPIIATCGSGVTACILALALYQLGNRKVALYDGSWCEWATENPV